ncbi:MAG TPA: hypothetical protein VFR37_05055 [Longimicrobium sp.]|nr:hypothetical protein [Longimicrobium sp.]
MRAAKFIDRSGPGVDEWAARFGLLAAEALGREMVTAIRDSLDPGPGPRTGRQYIKPGTRTIYTASGPGEHPAVREGVLRDSFHLIPAVIAGGFVLSGAGTALKTDDGEHHLAAVLNHGTDDGRIQPRPFIDHTLEELAERWGAEVRR